MPPQPQPQDEPALFAADDAHATDKEGESRAEHICIRSSMAQAIDDVPHHGWQPRMADRKGYP